MSKFSLTLPPSPESNLARDSVMPLTVLGTIELNCRLSALAATEDEPSEVNAAKAAASGRVERWLGEHLRALRTTSRR
jgi:hypothetical protein